MSCPFFRPKMFPPSDHVWHHSCTLGAHVLTMVVGPARGVWGLGYVFDGKLYFTRDICAEKWIPKDLAPPKNKLVPHVWCHSRSKGGPLLATVIAL